MSVMALPAFLTVRPTSCPCTRATALATCAGSSGEAKNGVARDHTAIFPNASTKMMTKTRHGRAARLPPGCGSPSSEPATRSR